MPTQTRRTTPSTGRFASRRTTASRRLPGPGTPVRFRRAAAPKSTKAKAFEGIGKMLSRPTPKTGRRAGGTRKGKAGFALLAGAAGLALKNRDKLGGLLDRKRSGDQLEDRPADAVTPTMPGGLTGPPPVV